MTTTAHEDQFTDAPEPARQQYSTADILRRNVVDLEIALRKQTKRAEAAEAELARLREQTAVAQVEVTHGFHKRTTNWLKALPDGTHLLFTGPVTAPAVPDANSVQWLADEGDMILVPRGLLGAACSSIDKQRPAPKVLEALRYYTMNAPQAPAVPEDIHELAYELGGTDSGEYHLEPEDLDRIIAAAKSAPAVPEDWRNIVTEMLGWWDDPAMTMSQGKVIAEKARAMLQSAEVTK